MARVFRRPVSALARRASSRAARRHKVVMESVTQEKKKLRSVVCYCIVGFLGRILTVVADIV